MLHGVPSEGVTKFHADHMDAPLEHWRYGDVCRELLGWRKILFELNCIGQDPVRYDGAGFGNMSARVPPFGRGRGQRGFLVTGTQTGGTAVVGLDHHCWVSQYNIAKNSVKSKGPIRPSSESLTHGAIYDLNPAIRYVFHGHIPLLWQSSARLGLPTTHPSIAYGTPDMAFEVMRLYRNTTLSEKRILAMGGHEDGIIAFGKTAEEAGSALLKALAEGFSFTASL